jgi:hypothetical protein
VSDNARAPAANAGTIDSAVNPLPRPPGCVLCAFALGACVVPVGPEFESTAANYPPTVLSSNPGIGDIFAQAPTGDLREISAILSDQNVEDPLFVRWLVDYPGVDSGSPQLVRELTVAPSGMAVRPSVRIRPRCDDLGLRGGIHRLVMSASDRRYLDTLAGDLVPPEAPLDSVAEGGNRIRAVWLLSCP